MSGSAPATDEKISGVDYDGVWRPERDLNGRWIAARYVDLGVDFLRRYVRERDVEHRPPYTIPIYHDLIEPCEKRCAELNA